jgi:hypothetical protein
MYVHARAIDTTMHDNSSKQHRSRNYLTFGIDRDAPITVKTPELQDHEQAQNMAIMGVAESLGRRTQIRVSVEIWSKWNGRWQYKRFRSRHATVSCPNPEQAEIMIEAVLAFAKSVDGNWLARTPKKT